MLRYKGSGIYEYQLCDGEILELSEAQLRDLHNEMVKIKVVECKATDEDYESLASENRHMANYLEEVYDLNKDDVSEIALSGSISP